MKNNNKRGFTIIEMVIVIAIIGILAAVLIPTYGNVVQNANESSAMQSCRSTMTNWLATYTTGAGVPQSFDTTKNNTYYPAYFEFKNENGTTYQYRYTKGGIERTDDNLNKKFDTAKWHYAKVYLIDPTSVEPTKQSKYLTTVYKVNINKSGEAANDEIYYYTLLGADSPYTCGGADVYMGFAGTTKCWTDNKAETTMGATEGTMINWTEPSTTPATLSIADNPSFGGEGSALLADTNKVVPVEGAKKATINLKAAVGGGKKVEVTVTYTANGGEAKTMVVTIAAGATNGTADFTAIEGNIIITGLTVAAEANATT